MKKKLVQIKNNWLMILIPVVILFSAFFVIQNFQGTTYVASDVFLRIENNLGDISETPQVKGSGSYGVFYTYEEGKQAARVYLSENNITSVYWTYGDSTMYVYITHFTESSGGLVSIFGETEMPVPGFELIIVNT